jgi:hypothetical protein
MRASPWLLAMLCATGCGNSSGSGNPQDAAVASDFDGTLMDLGAVDLAHDLTPPTACNPVDDHSDGQPCGMSACADGTVAVAIGGVCRCYQRCTLDVECACDRVCDALTTSDGGAGGSACLPGNGAGTRCGQDASGALIGNGLCAQGLTCLDSDATHRYCAYDCTTAGVCPAQTTCDPLSNGASACGLMSAMLASDVACNGGDCAVGLLCDGVCRTQCDGPGAACTSGTCSALADGTRIIGYVCK